jgi:hypothetical protein
MDYLLRDNFELKKSLAYDKKKYYIINLSMYRYLDLMNAFLELRQQMNIQQ